MRRLGTNIVPNRLIYVVKKVKALYYIGFYGYKIFSYTDILRDIMSIMREV